MSDFLAVLGAGIAIIVAALLLSGSSFLETSQDNVNATLLSETAVGQVGAIEETFRHIPLGSFTIGQTLGEETVKEVPAIRIEKGWFREHFESYRFSGTDATNAYVTFAVEDTNYYGNLQLIFNNRMIYDNVTYPGNYRVDILDLSPDNTLDIRAGSSGPKFWAPTTYLIKDLKLVVRRYGMQDKVIPFRVYDYEATGWGRGRLTFGIDDAILDGDLVVTINGNEIYRDRPISRSLIHQKDFSREAAQIKPGENTIRFRTEKNGKYTISGADMIAFFYAGGQSVAKTFKFNAKATDADSVNNGNYTGVVSFDAIDVFLDSGMTVYINDKPLELAVVRVGENNVTFGAGYLREGTNKLRLVTRGSYKIGSLKLNLLKPKEKDK